MKSKVKNAIEEKVIENCYLIGEKLRLILEQQNTSIHKLVHRNFEVLHQKLEEVGWGIAEEMNGRYDIRDDGNLDSLDKRINDKVGKNNAS